MTADATKCSGCGLTIRHTAAGPEFDNAEFIECCKNFKVRVEGRHQPNKPLQQQMAECPDLNETIAKAS